MLPLSPLQLHRLTYIPQLPLILRDFEFLIPEPIENPFKSLDKDLDPLFSGAGNRPILKFKKGSVRRTSELIRVGIVLSGGQAPGGHNVIWGLYEALKKLNSENVLIGFCEGPMGILKNKSIIIDEKLLGRYKNQGGFDLLGSGRTKIETAEQLAASESTIKQLDLDGLVIVGGDDSNTNAAFLAEFFLKRGVKTRVVGVPKTIDGDLKNEFIKISFGFDTACKVYSEIIGNTLKDAISTKKYYHFIRLMGRSASHITLECALRTRPNLAFIGEEVAKKKQSLTQLVEQVADMVCARAKIGKNYGGILIPEGIIEFIPEFKEMIRELNAISMSDFDLGEQGGKQKRLDYLYEKLSTTASDCFGALPEQIQDQLLLDRDPHGNVQVSKIETERLFIALVERELNRRKLAGIYSGHFNAQPLFCGYEGRSGLPSNFDCGYCYALGFLSALLIEANATGYIGSIGNLSSPAENWEVAGIPIANMLHREEREGKQKSVIRKALVDLDDAHFLSFTNQRTAWILEDHYCCPGPIQFEGPKHITDTGPLTL
jgi:pyrophosphate--fructose-6-phosphate 1-phosphotransferase